MDLRQLRYFVAIADARSFARGADYLRIAQPALSRSIAKLEESLDQVLFLRHANGVTLTDKGQLLYKEAVDLLERVRHVQEAMASARGEPEGIVTFGAPQSIQAKLAIPVASRFLHAFPRCSLEIVQNSSGKLHDDIAQDLMDIVILSDQSSVTGMLHQPLLRESICLICRQDVADQFSPTVEIEELIGMPLIICGYPMGQRRELERMFQKLGKSPNVRSEVNASSMLIDLVARDVGLGIAPYCVTAQEASTQLAAIPINGLTISWSLGINRTRQDSLAVQKLRAMLADHVCSVIENGDWPTAELLWENPDEAETGGRDSAAFNSTSPKLKTASTPDLS